MGCGNDGIGFDLNPRSCTAAFILDGEFMIAMPNAPLGFDSSGVLMGASLAICVAHCIPFLAFRYVVDTLVHDARSVQRGLYSMNCVRPVGCAVVYA